MPHSRGGELHTETGELLGHIAIHDHPFAPQIPIPERVFIVFVHPDDDSVDRLRLAIEARERFGVRVVVQENAVVERGHAYLCDPVRLVEDLNELARQVRPPARVNLLRGRESHDHRFLNTDWLTEHEGFEGTELPDRDQCWRIVNGGTCGNRVDPDDDLGMCTTCKQALRDL